MIKRNKKNVSANVVAAVTTLAISLGVMGCGGSGSSPDRPLNVIVISLDTCRADHLGSYGHAGKSTPNIDAMARDGATFLLAQTTNPLTLPAHCSMMTGKIPPEHGVRDNSAYRLDGSSVTLAERVREQGYATAAFVGGYPLDSITGLDQGFDLYDDEYTMARSGKVADERRAMEVSQSAIEWLRGNHQAPFFMFVHYYDPHAPYAPPEPFATEHADDPYLGEIAYTDHAVGLLIEELKKLGVYDSSLVIVTSDHGESLGEHKETSHGFFVYQSTMHVPLIVKGPGYAPGTEVTEPVSVSDITPTVLAALGLEPEDPLTGMDLSAWVGEEKAKPGERLIYGESLVPTMFGCNAVRSVVQDEWHYIWTNRPELYRLSEGLDEQRNRIDEQPQLARQLRDALEQIARSRSSAGETDGEVDPERMARLKGLGYVGGGPMRTDVELDPTARDPKDFVEDYVRLTDAMTMRYDGKLAEARAISEEILAEDPDSLWANNIAGLVALDERRLDDARTYFSSYVALLERAQETAMKGSGRRVDYELAEAYDHLGRVLALSGDTATALTHMEHAVELQPEVAIFHNNLGTALEQLGRFEPAQQHLERAIELRPSYANAHKNLGIVLGKRGNWAAARPHLEIAVRSNPNSVGARYALGHCLASLGDFEGAASEFSRVIELQPEHAPARNDLARVNAVLRDRSR